VAAFAQTTLEGKKVDYAGNPLQDFSLIKFLDKFVYRNPKKESKPKGSSLMQPLPSGRSKETPVNSRNFGKTAAVEVESDEIFFHRFFSEKQRRLAGKEPKEKKKEDDEDAFSLEDSDGDGDGDLKESDDEDKKKKSKKKEQPEEVEQKEEDSDSDAAYENMPSDSDAEDDGGEFGDDADPEEEKRLERMLLKGLKDEDFENESFGDEDDDEDNDIAEGDDSEEEREESDDENEADDDEDEDDDDDVPFPLGDDDDDVSMDDDDEDDDDASEDEDEGEDEAKTKGSKKRKRGEDLLVLQRSPSKLTLFFFFFFFFFFLEQEDKIRFGGSTFASAEEFSHLLEGPGTTKSSGKQDLWDRRASEFDHRNKRRKTGGGDRGRGGFKGHSSRGGSKSHGKPQSKPKKSMGNPHRGGRSKRK